MQRIAAGILSEIVEHKKLEAQTLYNRADEYEQQAARAVTMRRAFREKLEAVGPAIIAEIKKASPSKGIIQAEFAPALIAPQYEAGGAACLSVLTDKNYFEGSLADLQLARGSCQLPVLRKDFTVDSIQVLQSAASGADAILLIAAALSEHELRTFREAAEQWSMMALVEVHNAAELQMALDSGASVIGVNNRNLQTFEVSLDTSLDLASAIPSHVLRVSESGISTAAHVQLLRSAGFNAFLVGETLMRSADPVRVLRELQQNAA